MKNEKELQTQETEQVVGGGRFLEVHAIKASGLEIAAAPVECSGLIPDGTTGAALILPKIKPEPDILESGH